MAEQFTNNGSSNLNGTISNAVTTLVVFSASSFPSSGNFRILIDSEIMLVTAVSGTSFTVTRGQEGTSAASHSTGAVVLEIFTAGSLLQGIADRTAPLGTFTVLGSVSTFVFTNQGSASATLGGNGLTLIAPATGTSGDNLVAFMKAVPATPYVATVGFSALFGTSGFSGVGITLSDGTQFADMTVNWRRVGVINGSDTTSPNTLHFQLDQFSNTSTFTNKYIECGALSFGPVFWFRIADNGTNRTYSYSPDGVNFSVLATTTSMNFLTPTKIGFILNTNANSGSTVGMQIFSYVD